ncbi:MAG: sugar transferase [Desulfobulbaceae bacterium]|nr:MAG: sugar transferase [Desulfobulbaceae bacterium]
MKRLFDLIIAISILLLLVVPFLCIAFIVKLSSKGPILYWSDRIGKDNIVFKMPKFRTMLEGTPVVATHLLENPDQYITGPGKFLRMSSLDELPQLINIIKGEMSFVGPRPALFNQKDLISLRTQRGVHKLTPGLTGWAQINGRDELPIALKVELDEYYLIKKSFLFDLKILFKTLLIVIKKQGVLH